MTTRSSFTSCKRGAAGLVGVSLVLLLEGCQLPDDQAWQEFVLDLMRGTLAAWLL
jgi:hypothetical protein